MSSPSAVATATRELTLAQAVREALAEELRRDPTVFLIAFQRLGVEPYNGVVIEDAPAGVQAARAAGAAAIGVTNTQSAETLRNAGADLVVNTLEGLTVDDLERLVEKLHEAQAR